MFKVYKKLLILQEKPIFLSLQNVEKMIWDYEKNGLLPPGKYILPGMMCDSAFMVHSWCCAETFVDVCNT